ncbi:putative uncharacterized protein DDB_G0277255 isoform X4 [Lucilia cuprina]|uniref:putative uncharacterized protein DDB_G0277255 isoform X4 n=1 Tax=Lucilia cuprina TaxID=7375 RepID=UPI001F06778C|nr:putative uncharacterized protein DDB_G0277255 isoform X4 [Lucilia cuprina]
MWQPSLNKNFYDTAAASYISGNNSQQDELAANLLHLQKLQLTDLLPPLAASNSTTAIPYHLQNTAATLNLSSPPATSFLNYFQQHLRALIQRQNLVTTTTTPFPPWSTSLAGNNSSNSNRHLLLASAAEVPEATFLTPPPPPAPLTTSTAQILDLLPLSLLTDSFLSLNPSYPPSLTSTYLPPSTSLSPNLSNPQQLKLYKQYLALEKAQLSNLINSKNFHHTPLNSINGYHSASLNLSQLTAPIPNLKTSSSTTSSINCDQLQQQQQKEQRALRKRRDNLKDLFLKQSQNSSTAINLTSDCDTDELLPPPKKKWIRHYLKANQHHQLHNGNNSNSMMVDEIPPTQQHHHSFGTNSSSSQHSTSSQHSPPRHVSSSLGASSAGSHYMHMLNAAGGQQSAVGAGSNHVTHATPRRRTISSTSNGAGTREVHNKLEKNRRAHLKECYEALKNQLSLKDEDRRKTSNLAILGEALKCVQTFQKRAQELEVESEHLANEKINLQKRIVSLKRELGPKYEQMFSGLGIFSDIEIGSIPNERETINDTHSLSSGRGSTLYSSSSSLSSGGSNGSSSGGSGSNTMSSPVGAGLQTAMPTTISPVINKINHNSNNNNINSTSPISINSNSNVVIQQQQRKNPTITTTIQAVAIPTQGGGGGGGISSPPAGSPTALVTFGSSLPLSLTAKNISATAVTRGSPTPSTPSPSPSSSSGVSSSSSLISSSPPINGVINNGRNVTVNIPNGLKLQATAAVAGAGLNGNGSGGGIAVSSLIAGGIGNGSTATAAATILATSAPAQGVNNTNNGKFPKIKILSTIN